MDAAARRGAQELIQASERRLLDAVDAVKDATTAATEAAAAAATSAQAEATRTVKSYDGNYSITAKDITLLSRSDFDPMGGSRRNVQISALGGPEGKGTLNLSATQALSMTCLPASFTIIGGEPN